MRAHISEVYLPVSLALARLSQAYQRLSIKETSISGADAVGKFRGEIESFKSAFLELQNRGYTAFLTTVLEEKIEDFIITLEKCLDASGVQWRTVLKLTVWGAEYKWTSVGMMASLIARSPITSFYSFPGLGGRVVESRVLVARIDSVEFGDFFLPVVKEIRVLIKEVTLGAQSSA